MSFQQYINNYLNNINNRLYIDFIYDYIFYFMNIIHELYIKMYNNVFHIDSNNVKINTHDDIYKFLNYITNKWKNNNINNIELGSEIINLYNKYSDNIIMKDNKDDNKDETELHMKYYSLGWYIYQMINNK